MQTGTKLPTFLIVGGAKCGSTALYEYLKVHPEVFMSPRKEPNFLAPSHSHKVNEAEYRALFAGISSERAAGEASGAYLYDPASPATIADFLGLNTRIVMILRNPVDMAYALWGHMVREGAERLSFEEALEAETQRLKKESFQPEKWLYMYAYADRARFASQVERYLALFGHSQVKVYIFEEFFADPAKWYRDLLLYLGVDGSFTPEFRRHNRSGPVISTFLRDMVNDRRAWKEPLKAVIPRRVRRAIKSQIRWRNRRDVPLPPLEEGLREKLWCSLEEDVKRLEQMLGKKLRGEVWHVKGR